MDSSRIIELLQPELLGGSLSSESVVVPYPP
jgi:hypothetical protein